jgi:DNA-binding MarR family transcriptional regulator
MNPSDFLRMLRPTLRLPHCSARQLALLALLAEAGEPITMISAAINLKISKPATCRNIDMLQSRDLLERVCDHIHDGDTRLLFIKITKAGIEFLAELGVS